MNGRETYIFEVRQIVEVGADDREQAIEVLNHYPPVRNYSGCGFSIKTRKEIEVHDVKEVS